MGPPPSRKSSEPAKLKVRISLNLHGLVTLESVTQLEEEEYEEIVKKPAAAKAGPRLNSFRYESLNSDIGIARSHIFEMSRASHVAFHPIV